MEVKRGIAVLFPGIGYTNDRSLLYFSGRLAEKEGYELLRINYKGFPKGIKGDKDKMREAFFLARGQALEQFDEIHWNEYEDVLFISKSIGTVVASSIAKDMGLKVRSIVFTPLAETFLYLGNDAVVFHGTADPWAKTEDIIKGCSNGKTTLYITENANHSLETGEVFTDLKNLEEVITRVRDFIKAEIASDIDSDSV